MILTINNADLSKNFIKWLIQEILYTFILHVDRNKLKAWDEYLNKVVFKDNKLIKNISTYNILYTGLRTLQIQKTDSKYIISFDKFARVTNSRAKLYSIIKLITFGNMEINGYPIVLDLFNEFADNISEYASKYEKLGGLVWA